MSYTELTSTAVANADTLMNNFYHVAQGDLLPLSGASFLPANMVGYLGSATAIWKTLYCDGFVVFDSITSNGKFKVLRSSYDSTAGVVSITLSFTTGSTVANYYELFLRGTDNSSDGLQLVLNGQSGTTYQWAVSSVSAEVTGADMYYDADMNASTIKCFPTPLTSSASFGKSTTVFHFVFSAVNGLQKMVKFEGLAIAANSITSQCTGIAFCSEDTSYLESIKILWTATNFKAELWGHK